MKEAGQGQMGCVGQGRKGGARSAHKQSAAGDAEEIRSGLYPTLKQQWHAASTRVPLYLSAIVSKFFHHGGRALVVTA